MSTVPTATMERLLRGAYLQWLAGVTEHEGDLAVYVEEFRRTSLQIISSEGSKVARLGARAGFPSAVMIDLAPLADYIYDDMRMAAIRAGIATGLGARDIARQMLHAGLDKSYHSLERLARTEVVAAYWGEQWRSTVNDDVVMVWSAEQGGRTCYQCLAKDGLIVTDPSVRDHPNGRCTLIPETPERAYGLRRKGKNPHFDRLPWDGQVPQGFAPLARGLDATLLHDHGLARAVKSMVAQGWSSRDALLWVEKLSPADVTSLSGRELSQVKRALEHRAQELWEALTPLEDLPPLLYHTGYEDIGILSYTPHLEYALTLALNLGRRPPHQAPRPQRIFRVETSPLARRVLGYVPGGQSAGIDEYILMGGMREISRGVESFELMGVNVSVEVVEASIGGVVLESPPSSADQL